MTSLEDQGERLASIEMEENKKNALRRRGAEPVSETYGYGADDS